MNVLAPVRRDRVIADLPRVSRGTHQPGGDSAEPRGHRGVSLFVPLTVFSEGGRPAHPPRLPPHSGQRLPGAADGRCGVSPAWFGVPAVGMRGVTRSPRCRQPRVGVPSVGAAWLPALRDAEPCVTALECGAGGTRGEHGAGADTGGRDELRQRRDAEPGCGHERPWGDARPPHEPLCPRGQPGGAPHPAELPVCLAAGSRSPRSSWWATSRWGRPA